jgi:sulfoacetaldehyde dehydrogenase
MTTSPTALSHFDPAITSCVERARAAQAIANTFDQTTTDTVVSAAAWAILEPERNRQLAELAVKDTGVGNVPDKIVKNYRKTLGLLRDLQGQRTVGVIREDAQSGLTEIARPVGVVVAITPSTNPGATPANKIINALKARNAVIVAPSPKGWTTAQLLVSFIHEQFDRIGAPRDLVQVLPLPVTKDSTAQLMALADLVVVTGSQANVKAATKSGTPAFGVGAGNVAAIIDETADIESCAAKIAKSKTFDNATSCSSENSVVVLASVKQRFIAAMEKHGAHLLNGPEKIGLESFMWPSGKLSSQAIGQSAKSIATGAAINRLASDTTTILMVEETKVGPSYPFSGEKLSPVLAMYTVDNFEAAMQQVEKIYAHQGAGHSVSLHTAKPERALMLGLHLPVARVIVNQVHCVATGGAFDNGLPFSLSMGCGTWGGNTFTDNMTVKHYMNITRVVHPIVAKVPTEEQLLGSFFERFGR